MKLNSPRIWSSSGSCLLLSTLTTLDFLNPNSPSPHSFAFKEAICTFWNNLSCPLCWDSSNSSIFRHFLRDKDFFSFLQISLKSSVMLPLCFVLPFEALVMLDVCLMAVFPTTLQVWLAGTVSNLLIHSTNTSEYILERRQKSLSSMDSYSRGRGQQ